MINSNFFQEFEDDSESEDENIDNSDNHFDIYASIYQQKDLFGEDVDCSTKIQLDADEEMEMANLVINFEECDKKNFDPLLRNKLHDKRGQPKLEGLLKEGGADIFLLFLKV